MECCPSSSALRRARVLVVNALDYEQHAAFHRDSSPQKATASKIIDKQVCLYSGFRISALFFSFCLIPPFAPELTRNFSGSRCCGLLMLL